MLETQAVKPQSDFNVDTSIPKLIGIGLINVISAAVLGYVLSLIMIDGGLTVANILTFAVSSGVFMILAVMQVLFIKSAKIQFLITALETVAIVAPFMLSWSWAMMLATTLLLVFLVQAVRGGMKEIDNQIKINFLAIEKRTLRSVIIGLSLFISVLYVSMTGIGASFISKEAFRTLIKPADPLIQSLLIKDFSIDMSVVKLAESLAAKQFGEAFTALPAATKAQALDQVVSQLHVQAQSYGITFRNSDTVSDIFYEYAFNKFKGIPVAYRSVIPYALFILTYFTVKSVISMLWWIASIPAYVIYQFLLSTGFARIGSESRSREIIIVD